MELELELENGCGLPTPKEPDPTLTARKAGDPSRRAAAHRRGWQKREPPGNGQLRTAHEERSKHTTAKTRDSTVPHKRHDSLTQETRQSHTQESLLTSSQVVSQSITHTLPAAKCPCKATKGLDGLTQETRRSHNKKIVSQAVLQSNQGTRRSHTRDSTVSQQEDRLTSSPVVAQAVNHPIAEESNQSKLVHKVHVALSPWCQFEGERKVLIRLQAVSAAPRGPSSQRAPSNFTWHQALGG